jgi:hypothetical protein
MKVYRVWADKFDYDDYDAVVVVAENEDRALEIVNCAHYGKSYFKEWQGKIHIEEVDLTKEYVVIESFNAG